MKLSGKLSIGIAGALLVGALFTGLPAGVSAQDTVSTQNVQCQRGMHAGQHRAMKAELAKFIGIDVNTLKSERQSGKSLVQIAEAHGKTESDLFNYIYNLHKAHLDQLVKDGKMTQDQADQHDAKMQENIKKMIEDTQVGKHHAKGHRQGKQFVQMRESVAQFIGIDVNTLKAERQSGKSLVQIAENNGKSESDLFNYIFGLCKTHVDQLVKDGKVTQEQADQRLDHMKDRINQMIHNTGAGHSQHHGGAAQ